MTRAFLNDYIWARLREDNPNVLHAMLLESK